MFKLIVGSAALAFPYRIWLSNTGLVFITGNHRRRIYTEEKAKIVAAVWGTQFIQSLAALDILHQDDMKKRMNCTRINFYAGCLLSYLG